MKKPEWVARRKKLSKRIDHFEYWDTENHLIAEGTKDFIDSVSKSITGLELQKKEKDVGANIRRPNCHKQNDR